MLYVLVAPSALPLDSIEVHEESACAICMGAKRDGDISFVQPCMLLFNSLKDCPEHVAVEMTQIITQYDKVQILCIYLQTHRIYISYYIPHIFDKMHLIYYPKI